MPLDPCTEYTQARHDLDENGVCRRCGYERDHSVGGRPIGVSPTLGSDGLTSRERQVFDLLKGGTTQAEIGRILEITRQQVGQIVKRLREKRRW